MDRANLLTRMDKKLCLILMLEPSFTDEFLIWILPIFPLSVELSSALRRREIGVAGEPLIVDRMA
jgi:hypothetical protein